VSGAVRNKKEMRRNLCVGIGYESNDGDEPKVFASKGTYLLDGEQFSHGLDVYEAYARDKDAFGRWRFTCRHVRRLTKAEFVEKKWPKPVHGKAWSKK
jgi:hypothetical protein